MMVSVNDLIAGNPKAPKMKVQIFKYTILEEVGIDKLKEYPFHTHRRLKVFANKGCVCVSCGKVGTRLILGEGRGGKHWDVYTDDLYPFTVDHIVPKSKGGSNLLKNLQPMCAGCNFKKGNGDNNGGCKVGTNKGFVKVYHQPVKCNPEDYAYLMGQTVYRAQKKKKLKLLGEVSGVVINSHTGNLGVTLVGGKASSVYDLQSIWVCAPGLDGSGDAMV